MQVLNPGNRRKMRINRQTIIVNQAVPARRRKHSNMQHTNAPKCDHLSRLKPGPNLNAQGNVGGVTAITQRGRIDEVSNRTSSEYMVPPAHWVCAGTGDRQRQN